MRFLLGSRARALSALAAAVAIALAAAIGGGSVALAQATPTPTATAEQSTDPTPPLAAAERLERLFRLETKVLDREQTMLTRAGKLATRVQTLIDNQNARQRDTSKLAEALGLLEDAIKTAQADYESAKATVAGHPGFDAHGKVTDVAAAKDTVKLTAKYERQVYHTLRKAEWQMIATIWDFYDANQAP